MASKNHEQFVADQHQLMPPVVTRNLMGKTDIVVGENIGAGFEASKHFARMNPERLILACRNEEKGVVSLPKMIDTARRFGVYPRIVVVASDAHYWTTAIGGANEEDKLRGEYISFSEVVEESDLMISEDGKVVQDKVWDEMLGVLEGVDPKVADVACQYLKN
ncbi:hypothetical protein DFS33DRAFT_1278495 [Desarmillaria ectypa]|nr:hypothetical protein DFS33DRAFT_1278495 [Desarmillaria ectypa]